MIAESIAVSAAIHEAIATAAENTEHVTPEFIQELLPLAQRMHYYTVCMERAFYDQYNSVETERAALSEEMRAELLEREANVARTVERFETIRDKNITNGRKDVTSYDAAVNASMLIDKLTRSLCPLDTKVSKSSIYLDKNDTRLLNNDGSV